MVTPAGWKDLQRYTWYYYEVIFYLSSLLSAGCGKVQVLTKGYHVRFSSILLYSGNHLLGVSGYLTP
jgi:hypothetical protein